MHSMPRSDKPSPQDQTEEETKFSIGEQTKYEAILSKLSNLDRRVSKLENTIQNNPKADPNANPDVADNVYRHLKSWILQPAETKIQEYAKKQSASNGVRQLLFERDVKALTKYGEGLKLETRLPPLKKAAEKMADAVFFLYQAFHLGDGRVDDQFVLVQHLHTLLNSLLGAYKSKGVPTTLTSDSLDRH